MHITGRSRRSQLGFSVSCIYLPTHVFDWNDCEDLFNDITQWQSSDEKSMQHSLELWAILSAITGWSCLRSGNDPTNTPSSAESSLRRAPLRA